ncbi:M15 family metallopeptidase [Cellulosimicrobium cellulans]|uniref:M15 family metallopeptidase n=1 Tax=Cellulosimicrobium cellulans TaxID=1710 RepID=UPI001651F90D|nr:M15 family metallopeptidase [Cellulosimicrobium cellulans]
MNKQRPLAPETYEPELTTVRGYLVHPAVADDLVELLEAAQGEGVQLTVRSAYRSHAYQAKVHAGWVASLGQDDADRVSARAGHSEHQTGLAVDLGSSTRPECDFSACFDHTVEGQWIAAHGSEFGFLVRYTSANAHLTGFAPEGWHLRYVGQDLAEYMNRQDISTLEEVFDVPGGDRYS